MKPKKHIPIPDWMLLPQTKAVMAALNDPGEPQSLFVGGCVRNTLLNKPVTDIDIATVHQPVDVIVRLQKAGIHCIPTGITHGTVTAVVQDKHFEITTLRRDLETDGRHATVAFTRNWVEDAARRDFTVNTLLADQNANIYDPLGRAMPDLEAGRILFVGNPANRIAEDYLRILRFFRFHALYGRGKPDPDALNACSKASQNLIHLSRERVTQEMLKILAIYDPAPVLTLMFENDVAIEFRNQNYDRHLFSIFCALQREYNAVDVMARLAILSGMDYDRAGMLMKLSGAQHKAVRSLVLMTRDVKTFDMKTIRRLLYQNDRNTVQQFLLLHMVRDGAIPEYRDLFHTTKTWNPPKFPLAGQDVLDLGVTAGPLVGELLAHTDDWWVDRDFAPGREECLAYLKQLYPTP